MFKIRHCVPLPDKRTVLGTEKRAKYPFGDMGKGDSFIVPTLPSTYAPTRNLIAAAAKLYGDYNGIGFAVRRTKEGVGCWRVS